MGNKKEVKSAIESLLFVWGDPLEPKLIAEAVGEETRDIKNWIKELQEEYRERSSGLAIREVNGKYQLCTDQVNEPYIEKLCTPVKETRLSNAAMETLAIIAYKQPISRSGIEHIRGVKSESVVERLEKRGLVEEKGRSEGVGRPILYGTTDLFLEKFGIASLDELPELDVLI